jgi:hypothetical protein
MHESLADVAARFRVPRLAEIAAADPRFAQVQFMVEADDFAYETLLNKWSPRVSWEADPSVCLVGLGILIGCNVNVNARFVNLNGHTVMFYWANSDLVDRRMVNNFVEEVRNLALAARPGSTPAGKTDPSNFHDCVNFCERS